MITFLIERAVPPGFRFEDPETLARHCRWATDAYRAVGAMWLGGVVTERGMFGLATAESADDLERYRTSLGIAPEDLQLRRVLAAVGPFLAAPRP